MTNNYKRICLLDTVYKQTNAFRKGRYCSENVFTNIQLIEKYCKFNMESYVTVIDLKKAFNRVYRNILW